MAVTLATHLATVQSVCTGRMSESGELR